MHAWTRLCHGCNKLCKSILGLSKDKRTQKNTVIYVHVSEYTITREERRARL